MKAYSIGGHRHEAELTQALRTIDLEPRVQLVPHSGPFARGIHMTMQAPLTDHRDADTVRDALAKFYADSPFVHVADGTPRIKNVIGSNYAHIGVAAEGSVVAVFIAIDNLVKGAAGGAIQWMNLQLDLDEAAGLTTPGPGWI